MPSTIAELAQAREATTKLLDELDLPTYLFEIEPLDNGQWELRLEFQVNNSGTWEAITLPVPRETLFSSQTEMVTRQRLLNEWLDILKVQSSAN